VIGNTEPGTVVSAEGILTVEGSEDKWIKLGENRYMLTYDAHYDDICMRMMTFTPNKGQWVVRQPIARVRGGPSQEANEITVHDSGIVVSAEGIVTVEGSENRWIKLGENRYMMTYNADQRLNYMQQQVWKWK
jgi:hypothetical protein